MSPAKVAVLFEEYKIEEEGSERGLLVRAPDYLFITLLYFKVN